MILLKAFIAIRKFFNNPFSVFIAINVAGEDTDHGSKFSLLLNWSLNTPTKVILLKHFALINIQLILFAKYYFTINISSQYF